MACPPCQRTFVDIRRRKTRWDDGGMAACVVQNPNIKCEPNPCSTNIDWKERIRDRFLSRPFVASLEESGALLSSQVSLLLVAQTLIQWFQLGASGFHHNGCMLRGEASGTRRRI